MNPPFHKKENIMENVEIRMNDEVLNKIKKLQDPNGYDILKRQANAITAISEIRHLFSGEKENEAFASIVNVACEYTDLLNAIYEIAIDEK